MKKIILFFVIIFIAALSANADRSVIRRAEARMITGIIGGSVPAASGGDCPSWGTYYFAWDGEHGDGNTTACVDSGNDTEVATGNSGTFDTDGGVIWVFTDDEDSLIFGNITGTDIPHDDATGVTVCIEFKIASHAANSVTLWEFIGDGDEIAWVRLIGGGDTASHQFNDASANGIWWSNDTFTDDGSTYNVIGQSWIIDTAANDSAGCTNDCTVTPTWVEYDKDYTAWPNAVETDIRFGEGIFASTAVVGFSVRKFVVMPGYTTACPF